MISISEIKKNGMYFVKQNYWYSVLVALILFTVSTEVQFNINLINIFNNNNFSETYSSFIKAYVAPYYIIIVFALLVLLSLIYLFSAAFRVFALNPIRSGCIEYMHRNVFSKPSFINVLNGFRNNYKNKVKTLFLVDLYTFLWTLLFIVPGIIKVYEYRLVPYIIAENPAIASNDALKLSRNMMKGNKGSAFLYDLSFVGWSILNALSFGVVGTFYYYPYKASCDAVLYETIKRDFRSAVE